MVKIKNLYVQNFCGYRKAFFNFQLDDNSIKPFVSFFGQNGCGKSSALNAISMLGSAHRLAVMPTQKLFRKLIYHPNYNPSYQGFIQMTHEMVIQGVFDTDKGQKKVRLTSSKGVQINELPKPLGNWVTFVDADNPLNMNKFQLNTKAAKKFLAIAQVVYGFKVELGQPVSALNQKQLVQDMQQAVDGNDMFHTNVMIYKYGDIVHYKNMSAGQKKISCLLRQICTADIQSESFVYQIDNVQLHIYKDRHIPMIKKLLQQFPDKQFITTTHSPILVGCQFFEGYLKQNQKFDVMKIKAHDYNLSLN